MSSESSSVEKKQKVAFLLRNRRLKLLVCQPYDTVDNVSGGKWSLPSTDVYEGESHQTALKRLTESNFFFEGIVGDLQTTHKYYENGVEVELFIYRVKIKYGEPRNKSIYKDQKSLRIDKIVDNDFAYPYNEIIMDKLFGFLVEIKSVTGGY